MKYFIVLLFFAVCASEPWDANAQLRYAGLGFQPGCVDDQHAVQTYRNAIDTFIIKLYRKIAHRGNYFLAMSAYPVWITLAAIAEGADPITQKELLKFLELPDNACTRQKLYQIATTRVFSSRHVTFTQSRVLIIDEGAHLLPNWKYLVQKHSLLKTTPAPIKYDPIKTAGIIDQIVPSYSHKLDLSGNSILLNSIDFSGLWTTAFADAIIERSPFYDPAGQRVGSVDLMRVKRKVRIGYSQSINSKVLELPIGVNGEYSIIFALALDNALGSAVMALKNYTINEVLSSLQESYLPVEVAVPRFVINSDINLKDTLEELGIANLWKTPEATRYISSPPAMPSSYVQRVRISINNAGINPAPKDPPPYLYLNEEEKYWNEFVMDRPFMFGLFDTETYTCLMGAIFTRPTYPY